MTDFFSLTGPRYGPANGGAAERLVILLHGLGADGNDLIGLAPHFAQAVPNALFVSPNAPFPCDMAPFGYQWFSLQDRTPEALLAGVRMAAPILNGFIDQMLEETGLDAEKTALVGFSQGTMLSLYTAPRRDEPLAGIVGYSGLLLGGDRLADEAASRMPIVLVHGEADEIVPAICTPRAAEGLKAAGFEVDFMLRPGLPHGIDAEGIEAGSAFLTRVLA